MTIVEISSKEYDLQFGNDQIFYNTAAFNALNKSKCEEIFHLMFKDKKNRLGIVLGLKKKCLISPFSAPFGGFSVIDEKLSVQHIEDAVDALKEYCVLKGVQGLSITLPPLFYKESFLTKVHHVLLQKGFNMESLDLNYLFHLENFSEKYYTEIIARNARKNLTIALTKEMSFREGSSDEDLMTAYQIIKMNRLSKGFSLSMTAKEVQQTSEIVKVDSFIVSYEGVDIASAIVYHVTNKIVQVIYWGDLPEYASNKTMNFLPYKIFEHYHQQGYGVIDVGTAMLDNKPNYGLCDFKESIGCSIQPKCAFTMKF